MDLAAAAFGSGNGAIPGFDPAPALPGGKAPAALPPGQSGPLATALGERARRLGDAFRRVVFAQVRISAVNAVLTAIYLVGVLPLFGVPEMQAPFDGSAFVPYDVDGIGGWVPTELEGEEAFHGVSGGSGAAR